MTSLHCRTGSRTGFTMKSAGLMAGAVMGLILFWASGSLLAAEPSGSANEPAGPWECSGYSGDAHARCLHALIEVQQNKISKLEGELRSQQSSVNELRDRVERQRAASADLERQLSDRSYASQSYTAPPAAYPYSYAYPPVGLGLYLGNPWYGYGFGYGSSYFYRPYFGPRIFIGPRFFGPRHFGHHRGRW
jgi:hypothetical protein